MRNRLDRTPARSTARGYRGRMDSLGDAPAIVARGLTKRFGKVLALDGLDLEVPQGVVFGLLGLDGAGKTTTMRLLTGLARPTSGSVAVGGVPVRFGNGLAARRRIGVLGQEPQFYGWMTGRELLSFVAALVGVARRDVPARVEETLQRVGLDDVADTRVLGYPGDMRQRLGIGQALIGKPEVLLLDEPVSSIDPEGRRDLLTLIGELRGSATVVMATHVLSDVEAVCDRVAILEEGRLVIESPVAELLGQVAVPAYIIETDAGPGLALAGLAARLEREPWVGNVTISRTTLRITVTDEERANAELPPAIVGTGLSISAFLRERATLEDVLVKLTGVDQ